MKKGSKHTPGAIAKNRASALARPRGWAPRGERHYKWNGGKYIDKRGYVLVHVPGHQRAIRKGHVFEHRLVMEKMLGRYLEPWEQVHHRNRIKTDNRPENLQIIANAVHLGEVECPYCHGSFLIK